MVPVIGLEPTTPSLRRIALCIIYNNLQQKSSGLPRFLLFFMIVANCNSLQFMQRFVPIVSLVGLR